ncbi:MAG: hypothetical protein HHJ15_16635 [Rhodoferax sp.]|uniref:hypothetical protein n=1 Tax=Rhodoferax sp. TaxID=50421 RepID=UPI001824C91E|nr:hypothetical protein [Rhodoferax sp.]NMM21555.1 hypothetical protein [Rhodoferax sp.]
MSAQTKGKNKHSLATSLNRFHISGVATPAQQSVTVCLAAEVNRHLSAVEAVLPKTETYQANHEVADRSTSSVMLVYLSAGTERVISTGPAHAGKKQSAVTEHFVF